MDGMTEDGKKDDFTKRENYEVERNRVNKCYKLKWL